jgi:LacI family transcriptional regulator
MAGAAVSNINSMVILNDFRSLNIDFLVSDIPLYHRGAGACIPELVNLLSFLEVASELPMTSPRQVLVAFHLPEALRDLLSGVTRYAREHHCNWQVQCVGGDEFNEIFSAGRCDGAIVLVRPENRERIARLKRSRLPAVNLLRNLHPALPSVLSDDLAIGRLGAAYLRGLGFRNTAFVSLNTSWSRSRQAGFTQALLEAGLPPPATTESLGVDDFRFISRVRAIRLLGKWARGLGGRCAVMAPSDFVARSLLSAVQAVDLSVPDDIAILGVDNFLSDCELSPVPLSSIAQDFPRMGYEAARLLDAQMGGRGAAAAGPVLVPPGRLHVRASTDVLAFDDPLIADAMRAIREQAATGISMQALLERVPLSRKWLDQRFKRAVGHTPAEEIRRCRLRAVRDLLVETDLSLQQIARRCGFAFVENMIRSFRDAYGMRPGEYRRRHRNIPA